LVYQKDADGSYQTDCYQTDDAGQHPEADALGVVGSDEHGAVDARVSVGGATDVNEDD
jgi:hypothetical protein